MKPTLLITLCCLLSSCGTKMKAPHDDIPGYIFPTYIERYEQMGYRYHPAVILSPARLEYVGTNKESKK